MKPSSQRGVIWGALALGALVGCAPAPRPSVAPQSGPYGPGIDVASGGQRVDLIDRSGALKARYRVRRDSLRVYGPDAAQLGRIRMDREGYAVVSVAGEVVCSLGEGEDALRLECGERVVTLDASEAPVLSVDARPVGRLERGERGWRFTYAGESVAAIEQSEEGVSVRTHDDARAWLRTDPVAWHGAALVLSQVRVLGFDEAELALVRGALAFGVARRFDALPWILGEDPSVRVEVPAAGSGEAAEATSSEGSGS